MANLLQAAPAGWNKWIYPKTTNQGIYMPDAGFPSVYTPATSFWLRSEIAHCLIPWLVPFDAFTIFLSAGGGSGTLTGALGGMAITNIMSSLPSQGHFSSIGPYPAPRFGFCIGTSFSQKIYTAFDIMNPGDRSVLLLSQYIERLENARWKRFYAFNGTVNSCVADSSSTPAAPKYVLNLDFSQDVGSPPASLSGNVKIYKPDGSSTSYAISGVKSNWGLVISIPPKSAIPAAGDFYTLEKPLILNSQYMLSGDWYGFENDIPGGTAGMPAASGQNLAITTENKNYAEGKVLGVYLWAANSKVTTTNSTTTLPPGVSTSVPNAGSTMDDVGNSGWAFLGFGNQSQIYPNDTRYKVVTLDVPDPTTGAVVTYGERDKADVSSYSKYIADPHSTYVRIEISTGGYLAYNNWYAPGLANQYIQVADVYYRILAHVESNIIDVSLIAIDGKTRLNVQSNQKYSIFNHFGWMINENSFEASTGAISGMFQGKITSVSATSLTLSVNKYSAVAAKKHGGVMSKQFNLVERWSKFFNKEGVTDVSSSYPSTIKFVINYNKKQFTVSKAVYTDGGNNTGTLKLDINNNPADPALQVGTVGFVTADTPYVPYAHRIYSFILSAAGGQKGSGVPYCASNVLCLDGEYMAPPYKINIPTNTRIGITDGYLFGIEADGSASARMGVFTMVTTIGGDRGLSSFFNYLKKEDWVAFQDPVTLKLTIRRGDMNFTDYPQKNLIVLGQDALKVVSVGSSPITLDKTQEWLRKIQITLPDAGASSKPPGTGKGILFGLNSPTNIYGFYVSGDGIVDLQLLRLEGQNAGNVASNTYSSSYGYNVSPVYAYKKNYYQEVDQEIVDVGVKVSDVSSVYLNGGGEVATVTYVNENQTLDDHGYFDIVRLNHGESLLIYGQGVKSFRAAGELNNSKDNDTAWTNPKAIFIASTYDDAYTWGTPLANSIGDSLSGPTNQTNHTSYELQYPLMILNAVDYLATVYNDRSNMLYIFARCYHDSGTSGSASTTSSSTSSVGNSYLGCFIISVLTLAERRFMCQDPKYVAANAKTYPLNFIWRHPSLEDNFILDEDKSWADVQNVVQDGYMYSPPKDVTASPDRFIRIMGPDSTKSQISNSADLGIMSANILSDGTLMVLYDSDAGIRAIFSTDSGNTWYKSDLVYARNARNGILIGSQLFYIGTDGVALKRTSYVNFYSGAAIGAKKNAGTPSANVEKDTQTALDDMKPISIGSGVIEPQRLSGYITSEGTIKVFFYNEKNLVKCMNSVDGGNTWAVASNF